MPAAAVQRVFWRTSPASAGLPGCPTVTLPALFSRIALCLLAACPLSARCRDATVSGGAFDRGLLLGVDADAGTISGYLHDGGCRLAFSGRLTPVELDQRSDVGEAYVLDTWVPGQPARRFQTEAYSSANGGFARQITLEPSRDGLPGACPDRMSLDRRYDVGNAYVAVRVLKQPRAPLYQAKQTPHGLEMVRDTSLRPPQADAGVWVNKTYRPAELTRGYVYIAWYEADGTPHAGYVREASLYPLPEG